mgnify:CR=1 FL=1
MEEIYKGPVLFCVLMDVPFGFSLTRLMERALRSICWEPPPVGREE